MAPLRNLLRHAALYAASLLPARTRSGEVRFFYGHSMRASDVPRFRRTLAMLRDRFEFVSFRQAVDLAACTERFDGRAIAFSFDDGYRDNFDLIAPVLDEFGARACFFLATNFIDCDEVYRRDFLTRRVCVSDDRYPMTWAMVRKLHQAGFEIGAHTADHVNLGACDYETAMNQVGDSKHAVELAVGGACEWFAWPYGLQQHVPPTMLPHVAAKFRMLFSGQRSAWLLNAGRVVIHRDHFEPGWPTAHVRYFAGRPVAPVEVMKG